jgi:transposase
MVAAIGNGAAFARGQDFSAWIGLVPKQMSTGDRTILGRITKRGNGYLRTLFDKLPGSSCCGGRSTALESGSLALLSGGTRQQAGADRLDGAGTRAQL